jgi:putative toxin-antitoxin system toxin component, PIN family
VRVVLDTNVLVAAFLSHGSCHDLLEHCFRNHEIVTTAELLTEFESVMSRKLGFKKADVREALRVVRWMISRVEPEPLPSAICRDPDDDRVLAAAVGGAARCIVTGDKDLLEIEEYRGIVILSPDRFWRFEERSGSD